MSVVWSERTPLHASSMPTFPVLISITLPCWTAGIAKKLSASTQMRATVRMSPCTSSRSTGIGHGTAMRMKHTGTAKWSNHGRPPAK